MHKVFFGLGLSIVLNLNGAAQTRNMPTDPNDLESKLAAGQDQNASDSEADSPE